MDARFGTHTRRLPAAARIVCTAGLSLALAAASPVGIVPAPVYAATADTSSELERLQQEVSSAADAFNLAMASAEELNAQIDAAAEEILSIEQEQMPAIQSKAASAASNLYKMQSGSSSTLAMLFNASSFDQLMTMSKYLVSVQDENVAALNELNRLEDELNGKLASLSAAKDDADAQQRKASEALAKAKSAAAQMQEKADSENEAEVAAAQAAAEQTASMEQQHQQSAPPAATQPQAPSAPAQSEESTPTPPASNGGNANPSGSDSSASNGSDQGSWLSGKASYYGIGDGFMGGTTASGDIVTETSMGVAMLNVPLGTRVEIRYRGRSVIAVVNDRGPYAGDRVIDMQPAVARALGFLSVGVDTVEYRFL